MPTARSLLTNTDVHLTSPSGDLGGVRDGVGESAETIIMSNAIDSLGQQGTHSPGGKTFAQFFTYFSKLLSDVK